MSIRSTLHVHGAGYREGGTGGARHPWTSRAVEERRSTSAGGPVRWAVEAYLIRCRHSYLGDHSQQAKVHTCVAVDRRDWHLCVHTWLHGVGCYPHQALHGSCT